MGLLVGTILSAACAQDRPNEPVRLEIGVRAGEPILSAVPAAGYRINGRVSPALELATGQIVRLGSGRRTADSAYFVEPPWARAPEGAPLHGVLRASVCRADESLCRIALVSVDLRD